MLLAAFALWAVLSSVNGASDATVAFSAALDETKSIPLNQIIKYNLVFINFGKAYDSNTGIFTAPKAGVYVFHIHGLAPIGTGFWLNLYHNETPRVNAHGSDSNAWGSGGNTVILRLKSGDRVYVKSIVGTSTVAGYTDVYYTTFSGYLIGL